MPFFLRTASALVALTVLLGACGTESTSETASANDTGASSEGPATAVGREFWSTGIVIDGEPVSLEPNTRITLRFGTTSVSAGAGCNNLGGDYTLDGDRLVVGEMYMTEMGCSPALHAQDDLVVGFLSSGPLLSLDGETLTMTAGDDTITLVDEDIANPDVSLAATPWSVTGFFDETAAWSHAVDMPATLTFTESGLTVVDACGTTEMPAELGDGSITVVPPDEWPACFGAAPDATNDLRRVLEAGRLSFEVDGSVLRLSTGDDLGLTATS